MDDYSSPYMLSNAMHGSFYFFSTRPAQCRKKEQKPGSGLKGSVFRFRRSELEGLAVEGIGFRVHGFEGWQLMVSG